MPENIEPYDISPLDLAAILCSRMGHDFAGPLGTIGMTLEYLEEHAKGSLREDASQMLHEHVNLAMAKLNFSRLAFGSATAIKGNIFTDTLREVVEDLYKISDIKLDWRIAFAEVTKVEARLLLNLALLAEEAALKKNEITIEGNSMARVHIAVRGGKTILKPTIQSILQGQCPEDGFDGHSIQPFYTGLLARELGGRAEAVETPDGVDFTILTKNSE